MKNNPRKSVALAPAMERLERTTAALAARLVTRQLREISTRRSAVVANLGMDPEEKLRASLRLDDERASLVANVATALS